ncbi:MAG: hypothetical protein RL033_2793 [Pseudomonadota bacterium]|jgi:hypothetical protein
MTLEAILVGALAVGAAAAKTGRRRRRVRTGERAWPFWVSVQRDTLLVEASEPISQPGCGAGQEGLTWSEQGAWRPLRDEREAFHAGYYLDGRYIRAQCDLGCDTGPGCGVFQSGSLDAREYIAGAPQLAAAGSEPPPACPFVGVNDAREVPSFSSRVAAAPLAVRIRYYSGPCGTSSELLEVIVEAQ